MSFGQQKADWFLSNKSRIDLIPEDIREIIINELNTMEKDYNSDVKQFWLKMNEQVFLQVHGLIKMGILIKYST